MRYHEAANFLYGLRRFRTKPGTDSTADLLAHLGDPHEGLRAVQVAGSNGKGSTARMLERVAREAGLDVGLYTSPHLDDVRERVRVNGRAVRESAVVEFVEAVREYVLERAAGGDAPTFFEVLTALALREFDRRDVDLAVLEVGIGGRLDATSAVDPVAAAVTSVTLEHTDVLGDTVAEIARDKAHVAPADRPLVTATGGEARAAVREQAGEVLVVGDPGDGEAAVTAEYGGRVNLVESAVTLRGPDWSVEARMPLVGAHQAANAGVAAALARQVLGDLDGETLARGLRAAHWPGRFEVVEAAPTVVLDGAHNPGACEALAAAVAEYDCGDLHLVFGAMHDKAHGEMAAALPDAARAYVTAPDADRAADPGVLERVFADRAGEVTAVPAVADAVDAAVSAAGSGDFVLVTGSLYTVGEARSLWTDRAVDAVVRDDADARRALRDAGVAAGELAGTLGETRHHVLELRLRAGQAATVRAELLDVGGACAVGAVADDAERRGAVLAATAAEFRQLAARLDGHGDGLRAVASDVRSALGLGGETPGPGVAASGSSGGDRTYPWTDGPAVMGVLNVTPDSFHDGGEYEAPADAVARAEAMVEAGADVVDVGGESTRPGADPVPAEAERERVVPVLEALADRDLDALVSVDTRKAAVARAALEAGADAVNDVSGLADPGMRFVCAEHDAPLVVMHSVETPVNPDRTVEYDDVVRDVLADLAESVRLAERAGLDRDQVVVDPGLGFGKTPAESFELVDRLPEFEALGCPVLVGHSHKSLFGALGYADGERGPGTVALSALAADRGADVVRVHDVAETVAAVRTAAATRHGPAAVDAPGGDDD